MCGENESSAAIKAAWQLNPVMISTNGPEEGEIKGSRMRKQKKGRFTEKRSIFSPPPRFFLPSLLRLSSLAAFHQSGVGKPAEAEERRVERKVWGGKRKKGGFRARVREGPWLHERGEGCEMEPSGASGVPGTRWCRWSRAGARAPQVTRKMDNGEAAGA